MASQSRSYDRKKLLGQVYTPLPIVEKILNLTGFFRNFEGRTVLDPACGDGRFLVPAAEFIINNSLPHQLEYNLSLLHGWDIDVEALRKCRENLDLLVADLGITVKWNLHHVDALKQLNSRQKFDYIVGNPPYIRIQHLAEKQRKYIRQKYSFCKTGSTDAYVAFFELASRLLKADGVCGFITPNSYFSSETARPLRAFFEKNHNLTHITNYSSNLVFGKTGTYSAITIFGKKPGDCFYFEKSDENLSYTGRMISFSELRENSAWQLSVDLLTGAKGTKLGEICQISVGLTTLSDALYLFTILSEHGDLVTAKNKKGETVSLEKSLLQPIVKGSKLKSSDDPIKEYILFPYQKDEAGKHRIIPEENLQACFPMTYEYLLSVKPLLDQRDNGKPNATAWYAFGRAQALDHSFGKKIIFSPMNISPNFVLYENPDCTVYSGYFIKYDGDYQALLQQLNSQRMADYIANAGRDFQGGYKGYNKKILEHFIVTR
jgi:adenine-specific DNA-methyltransferase